MATYNWAYKSGFNNPYNITVPSTTDDATRPAAWAYAAPWGNDTTGNGSRRYPYRTLVKAVNIAGNAGYVILGPGTYREAQTSGVAVNSIIGDGNVIIDGTLVRSNFGALGFVNLYNLTFRGFSYLSTGSYTSMVDCTCYNLLGITNTSTGINLVVQRCVFVNSDVRLTGQTAILAVSNNTFYKCSVLFLIAPSLQTINANLFSDCNVSFASSPSYIDFCLFWHCNFRFNATTLSGGTTYYPSVPTGYTYINDIATLKSTNVSAFGTATYNFNNCSIADPLLNNPSINDFSLAGTSPAKNRSYFGSYVGAFSIANKISVNTNATNSDFDNSTSVNLTIANDSLTLTDVNSIASIEAKPIANLAGRQLAKCSALGVTADRNGEFISSIANLATSTLSAGVVPVSTPYIVEIGSIVYNGATYLAGDRFTSAATSLSFTTSSGGVIREILQAPSRQDVQARFNDGTAATIDNTGTITTDTWYYVESGTATYNGGTYVTGTFLKGTGAASFTGSAILRPVFSSSDPYYLFELGIAPTTNNVGNARNGAIVRGNGHEAFDRTPANIFSINSKFIQLKYTIQVNNLVP